MSGIGEILSLPRGARFLKRLNSELDAYGEAQGSAIDLG